ncbi:MAG: hypothetical protein M3Y39_03950 [Chloroflexota bacterium]|nr:hypothetical protein [Chloroflexota bacterium]
MTRGEDGTRFGASGRRLAHICMCLFYGIMPGVFALPCARAASPTRGDTITVEINGVSQVPGFFPDFLTLHVNDTVVFVNQALPSSNYAISADDGSFASPVIAPGSRWSFTFVSKGAHVYRETTYPQHMVGELLVVDNGVRLLPTPNPLAEATVIAAIKSGQNPPDTLNLPVPTATALPASSPIPLILLIIGISGALIVLGALSFAYYQHYQQRSTTLPDEDDTGPLSTFSFTQYRQQVEKGITYVKQKLQALPLFHRPRGDDDDDDDWDQL